MAQTSSSGRPCLNIAPGLAANSPVNSSSLGRRITSWGSNVSDTGSLSAVDDRHMTPLPSPVGGRDWGFFPASSDTGWTNSIGRKTSTRSQHSSSAFDELRTSNDFGERWDMNAHSAPVAETPSSKSKTSSFFDTDGTMSPTPPPNPPSRGNSLRGASLDTAQLDPPAPSGSNWIERLDASVANGVWGRNRERSGSGGSIGTSSPSGSYVRRAISPSRPSRDSRRPTAPDSPSTKPLLHALETASICDYPSSTPPSQPSTPLPTAVEGGMSRLPSIRAARSSAMSDNARLAGARPPPINVSSSRLDETTNGFARQNASSPLTPSMDDVAAQASRSTSEEPTTHAPRIGDMLGKYRIERLLGKGAFSSVALGRKRTDSGRPDGDSGLVALKLVSVNSYEGNERMRISVMREVDVLKNIHHPSLIKLRDSFDTPEYTVLALEYAPGGELFDFVSQWHASFTEPLARRIFGELVSAVEWMHSIGLVHRDIKLENVLLMSRPFPAPASTSVLYSLPTPFVKLTDFGLSRFISPTNPTLTTRCGSEAYAAPELIMARPYDGRKTDAWALGVVLYALITGVLPFVEEPGSVKSRKLYLLRIAKGDYYWPTPRSGSATETLQRSDAPMEGSGTATVPPPSDPARLVTLAVRDLVRTLLVRDPQKRAFVDEIWESEWMQGEGRPPRLPGRVSPMEGDTSTGDVRELWSRRGSGI